MTSLQSPVKPITADGGDRPAGPAAPTARGGGLLRRLVGRGKAMRDLAPPSVSGLYDDEPADRRSGVWLQVLIVVVLPVILAALYWGAIASDRYVSETQLVVNAQGEGAGGLLQSLVGGAMMGGGGGGIPSQGQVVVSYLKSRQMVAELEKEVGLSGMFRHDSTDFLSRLSADATIEDLHEYFLDRMFIEWDGQSRIITVRVQAYTAQDAQHILAAMVHLGERELNRLSHRQQQDTTSFAREELTRAETRLAEVRQQLSTFRKANRDIDPLGTAQAAGGRIASIQAQLTEARTKLADILTYARADSIDARGLQAQIRELERQAEREREAMAGGAQGTLSERVSAYESLLLEEEFARQAYVSATAFLDSARVSAVRQHSYVIDFVPPHLPEKATKPDRLLNILTVLVAALLILAVGNLVVAAVREQARL